MKFVHKGLRRFHDQDDARGLNPDHVARIRRILTTLQDARAPSDMNLPGWRLHPLRGERSGRWSVRVSGNWRIVFRFENLEAVDVDSDRLPLSENRPMPMLDPVHPGEIVRECMEAEGWTVAECAGRLRVNRVTLSRLLNGRAGVSPTMALALERIGWSNADHWVRMQGSYDLAQARLRESAA